MNRKLKIAIVTFGFFTGGTERQMIELIKGIDRSRFVVLVAATRAGGALEDRLKQVGIDIEYFPINSLRETNTLRQLYKLRQYLIKNKVDVLHTFNLIGNTFGVLAGLLAGTPIIITSRRDMFGPNMLLPYGPLQGVLSHFADRIFTNASAIKDMVVKQEFVNPDRVQVINNGIDLEQFVDRSHGDIVRHELGLSPSTPTLGVIAELKPVKGHIYLFQAVKQLINTWPELRVLVIGDSMDPNFRVKLEATSKEMGLEKHIIFKGRSHEVGRLLSAIDISVLPSLSEGLSNAILESMVAGVPVITTNVGGTPEIVKDGHTGVLVPPANPIALANAISHLLTNTSYRNQLAEAAQKVTIKNFSRAHMVEAVENLYLGLAESKIEQIRPTWSNLRRPWLSLRRRLED